MPTMVERRFLRFTGKLWETGEFECGYGWETERIMRRPIWDGEHTLQLMDDAGSVLVETGVELAVSTCQVQGTRGITGRKVIGYLPFHPRGGSVVFRRGDQIFYRSKLAASTPQIAITTLEQGGDGQLHLRWEATHELPLRFNVVFVDAGRRAIPIAREVAEYDLTIDTTKLQGGNGCSLAVLATDGLRSAMVRSERFDLPEQSPRLMIIMPNDGDLVSPDEPISLLGHAYDLAGRILSDEHLTWSIDGVIVARGQRLAPAGPFEPGRHRIELACILGNDLAVRSHVHVNVAEPSAEQHAWRTISASLTTKAVEQHGRMLTSGE